MIQKQNKYLNLALILVSLFLITLLAKPFFTVTRVVGRILLPFLIAFGIAFVLQPLVKLLEEKFHFKKLLAQLTVIVGVVALFSFLIFSVVPLVASQLSNIFISLEAGIDELIAYLSSKGIDILSEPSINNFIENLGDVSKNFVSGLFSNIGVIVMIPVAFLYFFFGFDSVKKGISTFLLKYKFYKFYAYLQKLEKLTVTYLGGLALTMTILSLNTSILFTLIGLEKGVALGIMIGLSTVIPYFGAWISGAFAVIVALGSSFKLAIATLVVIFLCQSLDNNIITPNVQAKNFSLHPLAILLSMAISSSFLGVAGMLLAIPLLLAVKLFYSMYIEPTILEKRNAKKEELEAERIKYHIE